MTDTSSYLQTLIILLARTLLLGVICVAPWLMGGVHAETQLWLLRAMAVVCALSFFAGTRRQSTLLLLFVLGAVIGIGQLVPIPVETLEQVSPFSVEARSHFAGQVIDKGVISLCPSETRAELSLMCLCMAVCYCTAVLFSTTASVRWLLAVICTNGAAIASLAIIQRLGPEPRLFASAFEYLQVAPFGRFVNKNNGAGYMNMALAAGIGWFLYERLQRHLVGAQSVRDEINAILRPATLASLVMMGLIFASVVLSISRGAWLGFAFAGVFHLFILFRRGSFFVGGWTAILFSGLLVAAAAFGFVSERVETRIQSFETPEVLQNIRLQHWQDSLNAGQNAVLTGTGLGTHKYTYQRYDTTLHNGWWKHAENQYVETFINSGAIGLTVLVMLLMVYYGTCVAKLKHDEAGSVDHSVAIAGIFALNSQVLHGCFDFGLYIPANGMLLACLGGAVVAALSRLSEENTKPRHYLLLLPRWMSVTWIWSAVFFAGCLFASMEMSTKAKAEKLIAGSNQIISQHSADLSEAMYDGMANVLEERPYDSDLHFRAAKVAVSVFRSGQLERLQARYPEVDPNILWKRTSTSALHRGVYSIPEDKRFESTQTLLANPLSEHLNNAFIHATAAIENCPQMAPAHLMLAELTPLFGGDDDKQIALTRELAPGRARDLFDCGVLEFNAGRIDIMASDWNRALQISSQDLKPIIALSLLAMSPEDFIEKVVPKDPQILISIAATAAEQNSKSSNDDDANEANDTDPVEDARKQLVAAALSKAKSTLEHAASTEFPEPERFHLLGRIDQLTGNPAQSAISMEKAIQLDPHQIQWRYEYAIVLTELGRLDDALEQARWCVRQRPRSGRYRKLLDRLYKLQDTEPEVTKNAS